MGLPGAGKTTLADELARRLKFPRWNADEVRALANDWDFSKEGRDRQLDRMITLAEKSLETSAGVICDFVAPYEEGRKKFNPDICIWMDTIEVSRFEDTNQIFEPPTSYDIRITNFDYQVNNIVTLVLHKINKTVNFDDSYNFARML